jgi:hypothetical protein
VLVVESERVRNIVRFDARHGGEHVGISQLALLEQFSSNAISIGAADPESFFVARLRGKVDGAQRVRLTTSTARSPRRELSELLAAAHQKALGRGGIRDESGVAARQTVINELRRLDLIEATTLPLSTVLYLRLKSYESLSRDADKLSEILGRAIDDGIVVGDRFASSVRGVVNRWLVESSPRPGTVLEAAIVAAASASGLVATDLLQKTGANKSNVYRAIDELEAIGALAEVTGRKKDQLWLAPELVDATRQAIRKAYKR